MKRIVLVFLFCVLASSRAPAAPVLGGAVSPDGKEMVQIDYPASLKIKNVGGSDGAGLCVYSSINMSACWQNESRLFDFQMKMRKEKGGGWPAKVDQMIARYGGGATYQQYEGSDPAFLALATRCGKMPGVTWNGYKDPHYHGQTIAHMVNIVHCTDKWCALLDNNFIGAEDLVWMTPAEFLQGWKGKGSGWAVFLLEKGPPPPIPINAFGSLFRQAPDEPDDGMPWNGPRYEWKWYGSDPTRLYLERVGGRLVGAWDSTDDYFRYYLWDRGHWGVRVLSPFDPPTMPKGGTKKGTVQMVGTARDYGVPLDWCPYRGPGEESLNQNGYQVSRDKFWSGITKTKQQKPGPGPAPKLTDDSGKLRLTVYGAKADVDRVMVDWAGSPDLAAARALAIVQDYDAGSPGIVWAVANVGFPMEGAPAIVLQAAPGADGKARVLARWTAYPGAAALASAVRKADPLYTPDKDPDPARPAPVPVVPPTLPSSPTLTGDVTVPGWAVPIPIALGAAAGALLLRRKKPQPITETLPWPSSLIPTSGRLLPRSA